MNRNCRVHCKLLSFSIKEVFSHILFKIVFKIKYQAKRAKKIRKYRILGKNIIGPWPLDPLVICHARINSIAFIKAKKNLFGAAKGSSFLYNNDKPNYGGGGRRTVIYAYDTLCTIVQKK